MVGLLMLAGRPWTWKLDALPSKRPVTPAHAVHTPCPLSEEAAEQRKAAASAEDLNQDVVGGRIPRTLLKLLTYCRVSDKATCEVLLELGKVKVNGEVCDNPVALVRAVGWCRR